MEMSADWITIEKNKLDSLLYEFKLASDQKEVRVDITIDRDKEPYVKEFNELRWQGYNDFLKISSNKEPKEPDLSQEGFGEDNEKVGLVISDILGEYKFEKGIHNIVLYEKNIQKLFCTGCNGSSNTECYILHETGCKTERSEFNCSANCGRRTCCFFFIKSV